jgi:hypothetical protein
MAFVEVEADEGAGGEFVQFKAIGEAVQGVYMDSAPSTGQYAKPGDKTFRFLCRAADGKGMVVKLVDGPVNIQNKLKKAEREGLLKQGAVVQMKYKNDVPTDKGNPMKVIGLMVDPEVKPAALEALKKHGAAPAPKKSAPKPEDDLFGGAPAGGDDSDIPF